MLQADNTVAQTHPPLGQNAGNSHEIAMSKNFKLLISKDNHLYVQASEDFCMAPGEPIFVLKGKYRTSQAATAVKAASQNWIEGELTADSVVAVQIQAAPGEKVPELPKSPARLEVFLKALAEAGFVRIRLQAHEVARQEGTHKYTVKAASPTALEVMVTEGKEGKEVKVTPANVSNFVDIAAIKKSPHLQVVTKLQYQMSTNRMMYGHPEVHFSKPYRFTKGDFVNVAWA